MERNVSYFFHANGEYTSDPKRVRLKLQDLFNRYERALPTSAEKISRAQREPLANAAVEAMFSEIGLLVLEGDAAGLAAKVAELSAAEIEGEESVLTSPAAARGEPADPRGALLHSRDS